MKNKVNFDILESLRGLAALYVCIGHSRAILWIGGDQYLKLHPRSSFSILDYILLGLNMLTRLSTEFVIVFFVLSGFSIAHSLRNNLSPLPFYKRRFIRLYPPYLAALFWAMLIVWIIGLFLPHYVDGTYQTPVFDRLLASGQLFSWKVFLNNLLYLPQLDGVLRPFWSLTMEVIFYLLAPFVFRSKNIYFISSILMFALSMAASYANWPLNYIVANFMYYNIFFAIGVALYQYYDLLVEKARFLATSKSIWLAIALFFAMIAISFTGKESVNAFVAATMSIVLIIYLLVNHIEIKWLIGIGRFSYTLYITHFPTIYLYMSLYFVISKTSPPYIYNNLVFIPCIFLCVGVAWVHYQLVEKRSKDILNRLRNKRSAKEPAIQKVPAY